jgi:phosphohistidine swiveling domain-containing protein
MKPKKTVNEKLSDALETDFIENPKELETKTKKLPQVIDNLSHEETDYMLVRRNMKDLISIGEDAIDGIVRVATEGDAPRAYEVAAQMIKTVSEMNQDLIDLHNKMKDLKKEETNISTTNNSIYVGSTRDLLDLVNESRSSKKVIEGDIIDIEEIDDN